MMSKEEYMKLAIEEAKKGFSIGEIPVGAVIVMKNEILASSHNTNNLNMQINEHAEINAINETIKILGNAYLDECELYVTMEPCLMCYGAITQTNIKKIYFGVINEKYGFSKFINRIPKIEVESGICKDEVKEMLNLFFKNKRN